jgi:hypothetical protein
MREITITVINILLKRRRSDMVMLKRLSKELSKDIYYAEYNEEPTAELKAARRCVEELIEANNDFNESFIYMKEKFE